MTDFLLPIGSVVSLNNGNKKLMVIGVKQMESENPKKIYDYLGVVYPEGFVGENAVFLFDHKDILDVIHTGYKNLEYENFNIIISKIEDEIVNKLPENNI